MNIFFDTEFTGLHKDTTLISIGLIAENGKTFYAEFTDYNRTQVNVWIQENVINKLKFNQLSKFSTIRYNNVEMHHDKCHIRKQLTEWLNQFNEPIQLVSDVCHYDMVLFIDLFGTAFDIPECVNPSCHDINQDIAKWLNISESDAFYKNREEMLLRLPDGDKHNSLYDAKVIMEIYYMIKSSI